MSRSSSAVCLLVLALALSVTPASRADEPKPGSLVRREFVYEKAPFKSCHASTIAQTSDGEFVVAFFGGSDEGNRDVEIWVCRTEEGRWTEPLRVASGEQPDGTRQPCWNPVLYQPKAGPLVLYYKVGPNPRKWWGMSCESVDGGKTWRNHQRLPDGILGPIKNKAIVLDDGTLLCGSSTEDSMSAPAWRTHFELYRDGKWTRTQDVAFPKPINSIQPTILRHPDGKLQALGRTREKRIFQTFSEDGGKTWSEMTLTDLPNPNSGIDAVTLVDGRHALVYNPTEKGERVPLRLATSIDGAKWTDVFEFENQGPDDEYSYPAIIQSRDGNLHVTYTWRREKVAHVVVDPTKLQPLGK